MQRDAIDEFYRELDATNEDFVRSKFRRNGYVGWKAKHAKQWLDCRNGRRAEKHAAAVALWTKIGALGTISAAIVAAISLWGK